LEDPQSHSVSSALDNHVMAAWDVSTHPVHHSPSHQLWHTDFTSSVYVQHSLKVTSIYLL